MKKRILSLALALVVIASSAFAGSVDNVNEKISTAFNKEFVKASDIQWTKANGYYKATFKLNDHVMYALYTENGIMAGAYRSLLTSELPLHLQAELRSNYNGYWINDLYEYATQDGSGYFVTLENADQTVILKSLDASDWQIVKKLKK